MNYQRLQWLSSGQAQEKAILSSSANLSLLIQCLLLSQCLLFDKATCGNCHGLNVSSKSFIQVVEVILEHSSINKFKKQRSP